MIDLNELARVIISRTAGWPGDEAYMVTKLQMLVGDAAVAFYADRDERLKEAHQRIAFLEKHCQDLLAQREAAIDGEVQARRERDLAQAALREKA